MFSYSKGEKEERSIKGYLIVLTHVKMIEKGFSLCFVYGDKW